MASTYRFATSTGIPGVRRKLQHLFAQARLLIAVSGFIADRLVTLGAPRSKIMRHHIGIPLPADHPDDASSIRQGVLFVGRLVEKKGCDDLLAAVAALPPELRSTPLIVIGEGPLRQSLERAARQADLRVDFRGAQSNDSVRHAMREAAAPCAPSRRARNGDAEGLPITILEAAAQRLPVVSTTSSGIPEAIVHGESGLLVKERDRGALADALARALQDADLRRGLADAGRTIVEERFDIRQGRRSSSSSTTRRPDRGRRKHATSRPGAPGTRTDPGLRASAFVSQHRSDPRDGFCQHLHRSHLPETSAHQADRGAPVSETVRHEGEVHKPARVVRIQDRSPGRF